LPVIRRPAFRRGLVEGAPVLLVVLPFGVAFGVLAVGVMPGWLAMLTSVLVVSGAAQFAMIGLAAAGPEAILVAATGLALRHIPMSATLSGLIGPQPLPIRAGLAWVLVDETFGLTVDASRRGVDDLVGYKAAIDLQLYTAWLVGTAIGVMVGPVIDPVALGIEVLFPLLFLGLAAPLLRTRRHWVAAGSAVVLAILATLVLPEAWQVTSAAALAALVGSMIRD
jgi:predicted branched-subunit amino acid permease